MINFFIVIMISYHKKNQGIRTLLRVCLLLLIYFSLNTSHTLQQFLHLEKVWNYLLCSINIFWRCHSNHNSSIFDYINCLCKFFEVLETAQVKSFHKIPPLSNCCNLQICDSPQPPTQKKKCKHTHKGEEAIEREIKSNRRKLYTNINLNNINFLCLI